MAASRLAGSAIRSPVPEFAFPKANGDEMKRKRFTEEQIIGILKEAEL